MTNWVFGRDRNNRGMLMSRPGQNANWDPRGEQFDYNAYRPPQAEPEPQVIPVQVVDVTPGNNLASSVGLLPAQVNRPAQEQVNRTMPVTPANYEDFMSALTGLAVVGGGLGFGLSTELAQRSQAGQGQLPLTGDMLPPIMGMPM
ncbi:hypothetical protein VZG28_05060 [Synechococcus elongatus IITB4]|uniref:hypothetical protein n=1 Tax=Synechococcus elongatus TaxID=32046 RepID=UPI0030CF1B9D